MLFCAISSSSVTFTMSLPGTNKSKVGSGDRWRKGDVFAALMWPFGFAVVSARLVSWKSCQWWQNVAGHVRQVQQGYLESL